jgi:hypothetical protein
VGIRDAKREELSRLDCKTLDSEFKTTIRDGLSCSPFEAEAVLQVVHEVYGAALGSSGSGAWPGQATLLAVDAEEPAGKPVAECEKRTIRLTVHRGATDDRCLQERKSAGFRRSRIPDLCQEALSQGALLTREDLAFRIFFVSPRTISRDLEWLRKAHPRTPIPLRSTVHDIGPVLTHRTQIVRLALEGKTTSQICQIMRHSPAAVDNYVSTFARCAQLAKENMQAGQIAFLLRRGRGLIQRYLELLEECRKDKNLRYHLEELLRIGQAGAPKKGPKETCR